MWRRRRRRRRRSAAGRCARDQLFNCRCRPVRNMHQKNKRGKCDEVKNGASYCSCRKKQSCRRRQTHDEFTKSGPLWRSTCAAAVARHRQLLWQQAVFCRSEAWLEQWVFLTCVPVLIWQLGLPWISQSRKVSPSTSNNTLGRERGWMFVIDVGKVETRNRLVGYDEILFYLYRACTFSSHLGSLVRHPCHQVSDQLILINIPQHLQHPYHTLTVFILRLRDIRQLASLVIDLSRLKPKQNVPICVG